MPPLLILKTGSSFKDVIDRFGDMDDWIASHLSPGSCDVKVIDAVQSASLPDPKNFSGAIITGSHANVTELLPWIERLAAWMADAVQQQFPMLGICFGHQILAHSMGGRVDFHPQGREVGTVDISTSPLIRDDALLGDLPMVFPAHVAHSQSVLAVPPKAAILAWNEFEPCHAFRIGPCAWGVQFHPEFSAGITRAYIDYQAAELLAQGVDPDRLRQNVRETPASNSLLRRFADIVRLQYSPDATPH